MISAAIRAEIRETCDIRLCPPTPEELDLMTGQIRRYGHGGFSREIVPTSHGPLALWHVVAPPLAVALICAWVQEWAQPPIGSQLELIQ